MIGMFFIPPSSLLLFLTSHSSHDYDDITEGPRESQNKLLQSSQRHMVIPEATHTHTHAHTHTLVTCSSGINLVGYECKVKISHTVFTLHT